MTLLLLQLALVQPATADAPRAANVGFPEIADGFEHLLVGEAEPPASARSRGTWRWTSDGVAIIQRPSFGDGYWFPSREAASIGDGAIRARIRFGERPEATLMFRCRWPQDDLERLSGYGLSIRRSGIKFVRWEKGLSRRVGAAVNAPALKGRDGVEVVVMLAGPLMTALVYDIGTL